MFKQLLAGGLLLCTHAVQAQTAPGSLASETFKQRLRQQYLHNDTAQAIISLYSRRQLGGASWIFTGALTAARIATTPVSTTTVNGVVVDREDPNVAAAFLVAVPVVAYGLGKLLHYGNAPLERTLTAYAAGQPLPRRLRRRLKPRFFTQPIIEYQKVPVQPVR